MKSFALDAARSALVTWTAFRFLAGPLLRYFLGLPQRGPAYPVRIRLALEHLGMTYLKLGQFMAMRFDILPMEVCVELRKLFENVPSLPFATIRAVVEAELGQPLERLFSRFETAPVAAASIAQVHEASSLDKERLAVKVQRPGIVSLFETDMRILGRIAALIDWTHWSPGIVAGDVISEFATYTRREMDFVLEGQTADRLRSRATKNEKVPLVYWTMTTAKVLTLEFVDGLSIAEASELLREQGVAAVRKRIANFAPETALHNFAFASLHQLFGTGFFHADPHPGNILLLDDNQVAFVDFGIFGVLTKSRRELLAAYIGSVALGNIERAYRYYARLSVPSGRTNLESFKRETMLVLRDWYEASSHLEFFLPGAPRWPRCGRDHGGAPEECGSPRSRYPAVLARGNCPGLQCPQPFSGLRPHQGNPSLLLPATTTPLAGERQS